MTALVPNVSGRDVAQRLGRDEDDFFVLGPAALAAADARDAASSYVRGKGFENEEAIPTSLRVAILQRAIRIANNAQQLLSESRDGVSMNYGNASQSWTLEERTALDEYRRRTASLSC